MKFHEVETFYLSCRREAERKTVLAIRREANAPDDFYKSKTLLNWALGSKDATGVLGIAATEAMWYQSGTPYFRIFPDYVRMFSETSLDIPLRFLKSPFQSFAIRFPEGHEPIAWSKRVASAICTLASRDHFNEHIRNLTKVCRNESTDDYMFAISCRNTDETYSSVASSFRSTDYGETVESFIVNGENAPIAEVVRQAISICFLATGMDKVIEPDVLNKNFEKYIAAVNRKDDKAVSGLAKKANEVRGSKGFAIGRTESVLGAKPYDVDTTTTHGADGHELKYRHMRKAHFHTYMTGEGRTVPKIRFVRPLIIRPDLPADTRANGGRTLRTREEIGTLLET